MPARQISRGSPVSTITPTSTTLSCSSRAVSVMPSRACYGRRAWWLWSSVSFHRSTPRPRHCRRRLLLAVAPLRSPNIPAKNVVAHSQSAWPHRQSELFPEGDVSAERDRRRRKCKRLHPDAGPSWCCTASASSNHFRFSIASPRVSTGSSPRAEKRRESHISDSAATVSSIKERASNAHRLGDRVNSRAGEVRGYRRHASIAGGR